MCYKHNKTNIGITFITGYKTKAAETPAYIAFSDTQYKWNIQNSIECKIILKINSYHRDLPRDKHRSNDMIYGDTWQSNANDKWWIWPLCESHDLQDDDYFGDKILNVSIHCYFDCNTIFQNHSRIHAHVFQKTEILDLNLKYRYPSELKSSSAVKSHPVNFQLL